MKKDIRIIPEDSGEIVLDLYGADADSGVMLLQRIWTILLTRGGYMRDGSSISILEFLDGSNTPPDEVLDSMLAVLRSETLDALDDEDRAVVSDLLIYAYDSNIICDLTMTDGTRISKVFKYG